MVSPFRGDAVSLQNVRHLTAHLANGGRLHLGHGEENLDGSPSEPVGTVLFRKGIQLHQQVVEIDTLLQSAD